MDERLIDYTLMLADSSLIMGHRLSEWTGHGPALELDIAISNIALDYVGQARNFYQYAALLKGNVATEDSLAYMRDERAYKNLLLTELPNGDWAQSILKIFFYANYQFHLYQQLVDCRDVQLSAIAEKSLKEASYHVRWSSDWVIRLGDGTEESHQRTHKALDEIWNYTGELTMKPTYDMGFVDYERLKNSWLQKTNLVLDAATLSLPKNEKNQPVWMHRGGTEGKHTEHLGFILAEMQYLQRSYPNSEW